MIHIAEHIKYLLSCHDCVVLPTVGAFVVRYEAARLDTAGTTFIPPCRTVGFNSAITHDDGLLTTSVSRREGISYAHAAAEVSAAVESLTNILDVCGEVDIDRVGTITRHPSGALDFTPTASASVANAAFMALPRLSLDPLAAHTPAEPPILDVDLRELPERRQPGRIIRVARYAASIAILLGLGFAFTTPVTVDRTAALPAQASFSLPAMSAAQPVALPVAQPAQKATPKAISEPASATVPDAAPHPAPRSAVVMVSDMPADATYPCYVIVASCSSRKEARNFISSHGGSDRMRILKSDGRYRVYIAGCDDYDTAYAFKSTDHAVTAAYPTAWVYRR